MAFKGSGVRVYGVKDQDEDVRGLGFGLRMGQAFRRGAQDVKLRARGRGFYSRPCRDDVYPTLIYLEKPGLHEPRITSKIRHQGPGGAPGVVHTMLS